MIIVDANLLIYAYDDSSSYHLRAKTWLEQVFNGPAPVGLSWVNILAFVRITTNPRVYQAPLSARGAGSIVSRWLGLPGIQIVEPGRRHWRILRELLIETRAIGPLVMDAHLAALAIEQGATLCTTDRDFRRFPGLNAIDPLDGAS